MGVICIWFGWGLQDRTLHPVVELWETIPRPRLIGHNLGWPTRQKHDLLNCGFSQQISPKATILRCMFNALRLYRLNAQNAHYPDLECMENIIIYYLSQLLIQFPWSIGSSPFNFPFFQFQLLLFCMYFQFSLLPILLPCVFGFLIKSSPSWFVHDGYQSSCARFASISFSFWSCSLVSQGSVCPDFWADCSSKLNRFFGLFWWPVEAYVTPLGCVCPVSEAPNEDHHHLFAVHPFYCFHLFVLHPLFEIYLGSS